VYPKINPQLPKVWDSTIRSDYVSCLTKGYYSFQRKLGSLHGSTDLIAGGAFAKGLEVTRRLFYGGTKLPLREAIEQGMLAALAEYGDHEQAEGRRSDKSPQRVIEAIAAYFTKYPPQEDILQPYILSGEPCVEFTFSLPLPLLHPDSGEPLIYAGRFDMLGTRHGQLLWVDEKTTSQLGPTWANQWNLRGQFTGYTWACQQYGYPVTGGIVRGISFTKEFGFAESLQLRASYQVESWYQQLIRDIARVIDAYKSGWYDQAFGDACSAYSGCPFRALCEAQDPENWIEGRYGIRDWDPLRKVPYVQPEQKAEIVHLPEGVVV